LDWLLHNCNFNAQAALSVEVISMPASRADGPAILIRIPDDENTAVGPRYFESMHVDGILGVAQLSACVVTVLTPATTALSDSPKAQVGASYTRDRITSIQSPFSIVT
jgi:hypothetical protein